ncbi:MAG: GxxExxY protein [bacterium]
MDENELSKVVIGCAMKVHSALGPGLLESAYEECLAYELSKADILFEKQKALPVNYGKVKIDCGYRLDFLIEKKLIIELKAVETLSNIHMAQVLTYLKLSGCKLGLLINFNKVHLKNGIKRVVHNL